jgi:hypothetical protein
LPAAIIGQTVSAEEKADTVEMPRRAIGFIGSQALFVQNALKLIPKDPKDTLAYVAIHGDKSVFKIVEDNIWKTITHRSLAKWIAETPAYNGKTIVLLSCSNLTSAEKLSISLTALDQKAGKPLHRIIAWEGKVDLFANGRIEGLGVCKIYQSGKSSVVFNVPKGTNAVATGKKIRLGGIDLSAEELAGGHSIGRHGSHLSSADMESRVLGTHSGMGQSISALKFISTQMQEDAVNAAITANQAAIDAYFLGGGTYDKWQFDMGTIVGDGYTNTTTRNAPTAVPVTTTKVEIALARDPSDPRGFRLDSAYPLL